MGSEKKPTISQEFLNSWNEKKSSISICSLYKRENEESFLFRSIRKRVETFLFCHVLGSLKTFSCLNEEKKENKT